MIELRLDRRETLERIVERLLDVPEGRFDARQAKLRVCLRVEDVSVVRFGRTLAIGT